MPWYYWTYTNINFLSTVNLNLNCSRIENIIAEIILNQTINMLVNSYSVNEGTIEKLSLNCPFLRYKTYSYLFLSSVIRFTFSKFLRDIGITAVSYTFLYSVRNHFSKITLGSKQTSSTITIIIFVQGYIFPSIIKSIRPISWSVLYFFFYTSIWILYSFFIAYK